MDAEWFFKPPSGTAALALRLSLQRTLEMSPHRIPLRLLQCATAAVFLGRAWQHWFWDAPFRTLLWDEAWMKGLVESLSAYRWSEYITSPAVDATIQMLIRAHGPFYLGIALIAIGLRRLPRWSSSLLLWGALSLLILATLYAKEKFFSLGQFLEYSLQFLVPVFLYCLYRQSLSHRQLLIWMKWAIVATFVCHGLYAVNYYPRPGYFVQMTMDITGFAEEGAIRFLLLAGGLDFLLAVLLFLPRRRVIRAALLYATFWGLATSLARVWAHFYWEFPWESLHQWAFESVYRLPHALVPLALWYLLGEADAKVATAPKSRPS